VNPGGDFHPNELFTFSTIAFAEKKAVVPRVNASNVPVKKEESKRIDVKPVEVMGDLKDLNDSSDHSNTPDLTSDAEKRANDKKGKK